MVLLLDLVSIDKAQVGEFGKKEILCYDLMLISPNNRLPGHPPVFRPIAYHLLIG